MLNITVELRHQKHFEDNQDIQPENHNCNLTKAGDWCGGSLGNRGTNRDFPSHHIYSIGQILLQSANLTACALKLSLLIYQL